MAIQMAPPESSGSGRGIRSAAQEPRKYIAFRPPESVRGRYTLSLLAGE